MKKAFILFNLLFFVAAIALAGESKAPGGEKVLKVYIMKTKKMAEDTGIALMRFDYENLELDSPSDAELAVAKKAIEDAGIKPEDLKEDEVMPLQVYVLEVKKAYKDQPSGKQKTANGIR